MTDSPSDLPYYYRRDTVSSDRTSQTIQLRQDTTECIETVNHDLKSEFHETVYKTDIVEAIILAGLRETSVTEEMKRMGYHQKSEE